MIMNLMLIIKMNYQKCKMMAILQLVWLKIMMNHLKKILKKQVNQLYYRLKSKLKNIIRKDNILSSKCKI